MTDTDLIAHVDDTWPSPMTPDDKIEWSHALNGLDPDYVVATVGTLQRSYPNERPTTARFLAAYRGVARTAEKPEPPKRKTGQDWADEIRAECNIPTRIRKEASK